MQTSVHNQRTFGSKMKREPKRRKKLTFRGRLTDARMKYGCGTPRRRAKSLSVLFFFVFVKSGMYAT